MYAFVTYTCIRIRKFSLGFSGNICHDVWPLRGEFETITVCPLALRYNDTVCRLLRWRLFALSTVEKIKKKRFRKYSPSRLRRYGRGGGEERRNYGNTSFPRVSFFSLQTSFSCLSVHNLHFIHFFCTRSTCPRGHLLGTDSGRVSPTVYVAA